jgi:hypothetical protein
LDSKRYEIVEYSRPLLMEIRETKTILERKRALKVHITSSLLVDTEVENDTIDWHARYVTLTHIKR